MPAGTASQKKQTFHVPKHTLRLIQAAKMGLTGFMHQAPTGCVANRFGLLIDFFEHKVWEATFFDCFEIPFDLLKAP